jgi:Mlc titration factor MtfA (ptsG expression regulator)
MPGYYWYIFPLAIALVVVWAWERWRRAGHHERSQTRGFPHEWADLLAANIPLYKDMPVDMQAMFQAVTMRFIEHKKFVPCGGIEAITDEMKVMIAGSASLLRLQREFRYPYDTIYTVLVYPSSYFTGAAEEQEFLTGEAWPTGSVVLAWDEDRKNSRDLRMGRNLIVHEFAHQLDMEDGVADGSPVIDHHQHRTWSRVLSEEFTKLQTAISKGKRSVLDTYGADDPAEFFAVATEAFFSRSARLRTDHPDLYEQLRLFYRVDPVRWG